jgi:HPt (histidine-containing phosphotransfer) domain-containing protein
MADPDVVLRLQALAQLGDTDMLPRLIDMFVHDSRERLAALREALCLADRTALGAVAHGIAGGAGSLGLNDLAARCLDLETVAFSSSLTEVEEYLERVERSYERAQTMLMKIRTQR